MPNLIAQFGNSIIGKLAPGRPRLWSGCGAPKLRRAGRPGGWGKAAAGAGQRETTNLSGGGDLHLYLLVRSFAYFVRLRQRLRRSAPLVHAAEQV